VPDPVARASPPGVVVSDVGRHAGRYAKRTAGDVVQENNQLQENRERGREDRDTCGNLDATKPIDDVELAPESWEAAGMHATFFPSADNRRASPGSAVHESGNREIRREIGRNSLRDASGFTFAFRAYAIPPTAAPGFA